MAIVLSKYGWLLILQVYIIAAIILLKVSKNASHDQARLYLINERYFENTIPQILVSLFQIRKSWVFQNDVITGMILTDLNGAFVTSDNYIISHGEIYMLLNKISEIIKRLALWKFGKQLFCSSNNSNDLFYSVRFKACKVRPHFIFVKA